MKDVAALILVFLNAVPASAVSAAQSVSRVYVSAYPCITQQSGRTVENPGTPEVTLYDRKHYGESDYQGFAPPLTLVKTGKGESDFYFDAQPGNYDAFIKFANMPRLFIRNGPLIALHGQDRHLLVAGCGLADWHSVAAIAGKLPPNDVTVSVLLFDHPVQCGDDYPALDQKTLKLLFPRQRSETVIDDGAYYANFHGYGKQERTVALVFSGALFTEGAVLVAVTPDTAAGKPPFIIKDLTHEIIEMAARAEGRLVCVPGF